MQKFSPKWPKACSRSYLCLVIFTPFHYRVLTLRHTLGCKLHLFPPFNPLTAPGGGRHQPRVLDEETRAARESILPRVISQAGLGTQRSLTSQEWEGFREHEQEFSEDLGHKLALKVKSTEAGQPRTTV